MRKNQVLPLVAVLAFACPTAPTAAADAPVKPARILLVTGGHPHDHEKLLDVFKSAGDIEVKDAIHSEDPAKDAAREYAPDRMKDIDAIVLYDLWEPITEEGKKDLVAALQAGKGLVVLHHAMANYQKWPEYRKIMGGRFFLAPLRENGADNPQSTAVGGQKVKVKVEDRGHPVTKGLEDFELLDEPYGKYAVEPRVKVLLTTDHPASTRQIGWCHAYGKARVVTLQPGHDDNVYRTPSYRKLIAQAIRWVARRAADEGPPSPPTNLKVGALRSGHPRLLLLDDGLAGLKALIDGDPGARKLRDGLRRQAERLIDAPTVEFVIAVLLAPHREGEAPPEMPGPLRPLAEWGR